MSDQKRGRKPSTNKKHRYNICLRQDVHRELKKLAEKEGMSVSIWINRQILFALLKDMQ